MSDLWAVARTECRLAWRRRSFWVSQTLALFPILLYVVSDSTPVGLEIITVMIGQLLMFELFVLPIALAPAISRDLGEGGDILWATPLDASTHLAGVALGLGLALLPVLVGQLALRTLAVGLLGGSGLELLWTVGLPLLMLGLTIGLLGTVGLGLLLRRTLLIVIGSLAFWIGFYLILGPTRTPGLTVLHFYGVLFQWMQPSAALGIQMYQPLIGGFALMLLALAGGLGLGALGAALLTDRRRSVRRVLPLGALALVSLGVGIGGYGWFSRAAATQATPVSPLEIQPEAWTVQAATLDATVEWAQGRVSGHSTLQMVPTRPRTDTRLILRLNPGLAVSTATAQTRAFTAALPIRQAGDSVELTLPVPPTTTLTLDLHWAGTPRIPYLDYNVNGFGIAAWTVRQPVRALVTADAGYLLRDGDWYPWPWTAQPRQAPQSRVTLHTSAPQTLATTPLQAGTATWGGPLPPALLVMPPVYAEHVAGATIYAGRLSAPASLTELRAYATEATTLWTDLAAGPPPTRIVALPYLPENLWIGDLLLVTEARFASTPGAEEQQALFGLTRSWLGHYLPSAPQTLVRVGLAPAPQAASEERVARPTTGTVSLDPQGRWVETLDTDRAPPSPSAEFAVAAWLVLELESPAARATDLDHYHHPTYEAQYAPVVLALHTWSDTVGPARAVHLVGEAVRGGVALDAAQLFPDLAQQSGVPLPQPIPATPQP